MFSLLRSRVSLTTLLVFSVTILGLMSVQNVLLYNTVEHETFSQLTSVWRENLAANEAKQSTQKIAFQSKFGIHGLERDQDSLDHQQSSHDTLQIQRSDVVSDDLIKQERMRGETSEEKDDLNAREVGEDRMNADKNRIASINTGYDEHEERSVTNNQNDEDKENLVKDIDSKTTVNPDPNEARSKTDSSSAFNPIAGSRLEGSSGQTPNRRKTLIIIGLSRSGTSYMCHMFNQDPNVFNIYEPMQMLTHWRETDHLKFNFKDVSSDMIEGIMRCNYTANDFRRKFVADFSTFWRYRFQSNAFSSEPFCKIPKVQDSCVDMDPEVLENVCLSKYKHTVVKLTYARLPEEGKIQTLIPILLNNPDIDIRILHFVRDPRGNFNSRIKLGWIRDYPNPILANDAKTICKIVERNILYGKNLTGWIKDKYRVFRYVDMFTEPLKTAQEIYDFAGFELPESVKEWIVKTTAPSEEEVERMKKNPLALVRNSRENVEKWKKDAPEGRTKLIEENCKSLIKLMGHDFVFPPTEN